MARKTRQVETRLIAEYLENRYHEFPVITNIPLGRVDPGLMRDVGYKKALGISRPYRPIADALVILPRHLLLIEAKVWNVVNGLAKLPLYKALIPVTPELKDYANREVIMRLVAGWTNPNLETMARSIDVEVEVFCPVWLSEIVAGMHNYWTKEYREEREKKLKMREFLNLQ